MGVSVEIQSYYHLSDMTYHNTKHKCYISHLCVQLQSTEKNKPDGWKIVLSSIITSVDIFICHLLRLTSPWYADVDLLSLINISFQCMFKVSIYNGPKGHEGITCGNKFVILQTNDITWRDCPYKTWDILHNPVCSVRRTLLNTAP